MALRCLSRSMFRYRLVDQRVPAMCLSLAAARLRAELLSGKAPTTRVRRRIAPTTFACMAVAKAVASASLAKAQWISGGPLRAQRWRHRRPTEPVVQPCGQEDCG